MQRLKDMLAELNAMLAQRARGEEPDFKGFMDRYGDFFPENPKTLDELLEVMARRMAAAQALLNSMTPGQRDQLQQLSEQLLADMDLNWQVNELARHLRDEFPDLGWDRATTSAASTPSTSARPPTCGRAGRHRPAREPAAGIGQPRGPRRGRHRSRAQAAGRRRSREPRAHG